MCLHVYRVIFATGCGDTEPTRSNETKGIRKPDRCGIPWIWKLNVSFKNRNQFSRGRWIREENFAKLVLLLNFFLFLFFFEIQHSKWNSAKIYNIVRKIYFLTVIIRKIEAYLSISFLSFSRGLMTLVGQKILHFKKIHLKTSFQSSYYYNLS